MLLSVKKKIVKYQQELVIFAIVILLNAKVIVIEKKALSVKEYLIKIRWYLKDIINNFKKSDTWKIQLTVAISFISSKGNDEECVMYQKNGDIKVMIDDSADEVMKELFKITLK